MSGSRADPVQAYTILRYNLVDRRALGGLC